MQTIAVQIQDEYLTKFMSYVHKHSEKMSIMGDPNLELDPHFYARQKQLQEDLEEVENGTTQMVSHNDLWKNINKHLEKLQDDY